MKRFSEEDVREYLTVAIICIGLYLLFSTTSLGAQIHELGHQFSCQSEGGVWMSEPTNGGYHTVCGGVSQWTGQDALNFYLSGIGAEVFLGLILMLAPFFSILGAFIFTNVGINMLLGAYATDLEKVCEVAPNLCFLQNPIFQGIFLTIGFLLMAVSIFYTKKMVKKINLFGPI